MNRTETFSPLDVTELSVHLSWPTLDVFSDDTDEIQILIAGDDNSAEDLKVVLENGRLSVDQPTRGFSYRINQPIWMQIVIRLPRSWKGEFDLSTVSGSLTARGLSGSDIALESASGDIKAEDLTGLTVKLVTVSGDAEAVNIDCDTCIIRSVSGDMNVIEGTAGQWRLTDVSGNITLDMSGSFDKLAASSVSGNVRVDVPATQVDAYIRSVTGRIRTRDISITENAPAIRLSTVSGDLDIRSTIQTSDK
ncbi:MAG: DUF4097 family beta strand repeat-containing protein [Clostridia bacterium]|nr:DUF4097 family beta strand repeat-containing protein [Clostridia bacterium]